eukprot:CAMPEP_0183728770 /NCGR_PEP_ID=MMETSP0737-20130205/28862_1 /TAXON_ID=385413 /ORGANISM="Thalassiosira miniscula, Strain CCMP1093" /LENGTH=496 /DNA_ID=CAMNT_0025960793 /DNA_START=137 /DNA_END=1627 /DNA_ORIENTATION=+
MDVLWTQLTTQWEDRIKFEDERHQRAVKRSWQLNSALVRYEMAQEIAVTSGRTDIITAEEEHLDRLMREIVLCPQMFNNLVHEGGTNSPREGQGQGEIKVHPRAPRLGGIAPKIEDYVRLKALRHFLSEGKLLSPNAPCFVTPGKDQRNIITDEDYLAGVIALCHDLAKVGVTRASNAGTDPIAIPFIRSARDAVSDILEELLQFDFRNGPLRRKYDSTKYALKTLETVMYELSMAGLVGDEDGKHEHPQPEDAAMEGEESPTIPSKEIADIRERTDHRDKLRENLIKTCRDGQKAAKQTIFALHRGDIKRADKLLNDCEKCITDDLLPIVEEEPTLRNGSFASVLEEYVEGKLFRVWLYGDGENGETESNPEKAVGKVLLASEISLKLSTDDYLGGLCDLTGEIGRYAVSRGTARDKEGIKLCLDSSRSIYMTLKMLGKLPRNVMKKISMVAKTVEKLERVYYEQNMLEMTGKKEFASDVGESIKFESSNFGDDG